MLIIILSLVLCGLIGFTGDASAADNDDDGDGDGDGDDDDVNS